LRDSLAGALSHIPAKLSQGEGVGIQIPLENAAKLREEGVVISLCCYPICTLYVVKNADGVV
jgi:hypothetical protein